MDVKCATSPLFRFRHALKSVRGGENPIQSRRRRSGVGRAPNSRTGDEPCIKYC